MPTKVFISWSGDLSRRLGDALRNWLPSTLQFVKPYFTPDDIEKGTKWDSEIAKELASAQIGVVCLTKDNTEKPWIVFEAGALSKSIDKSRVCPVLFDIEPTEIKGPLTSFQFTRFAKEDFKRLVTTINRVGGEAQLEPSLLDQAFEMWWPKLEEQVTVILRSHDNGTKKEKRTDRDILEELLDLARTNSRLPREAVLGTNNNLSSLNITQGLLIPAFSASTLSYTIDVASNIASIAVTPTLQDITASMTVNGQGAHSGQTTAIMLNGPGSKTFLEITITAQNGTTKTYSVHINRAALGGNNNLQSLTVSPGFLAPAFAQNIQSYTLNVDSTVEQVIVTANKADSNGVISGFVRAGAGTITGQAIIPLSRPGTNIVVPITITAPNGDSKTYVITIERSIPVFSTPQASR